MEISIKTVKGKIINLEVDDTSNTIDLKVHGPTRRLVIGLGSDNDSDSDTHPEAGMRIYVSTLGGKAYILEVEETETIENVKEKIQAQGGPAVSQQTIFFHGTQLENGLTLADYRVKTDSTLVMNSGRPCSC